LRYTTPALRSDDFLNTARRRRIVWEKPAAPGRGHCQADLTADFTADLTADFTADFVADLTPDLVADLTADFAISNHPLPEIGFQYAKRFA
jgi:hypothetical protein